MKANRPCIGVWLEANRGDQWAHQGMTRLLGFIIGGAAASGEYQFHLALPDYIRDEAAEDLCTFGATEGVDYVLHSPREYGFAAETFADLAEFANRHVKVDAWISLFPQFTSAKYLEAPVTTVFPDAIPLIFPDFSDHSWGEGGNHVKWRERVGELLSHVERVITFSEHVARDHVCRLFDVDYSRTRVVVGAPPDLSTLLPYLKDRRRSPESLQMAADAMRRHASKRNWGHLESYPFEDVPFIAVSTQDRVTKNIRIVADAVSRLVRNEGADIRMFMTAQFVRGATWSPLPGMVEAFQLHRDVVSVPDLPNAVHAAFYHLAELAIHPSIFEGGAGTFPFLEAASVGTPCLMADGPHQRELIDQTPGLAKFTFDPNDAEGLARLICEVRANRAEIVEEQHSIYEVLRQRNWSDVASAYARAALGEQLDANAGRAIKIAARK